MRLAPWLLAQEKAAKTLLNIAMIDSKTGMLADAITHARRARDLLRFGSMASARERERALDLVLSLESRIEAELRAAQEGGTGSTDAGESTARAGGTTDADRGST